MPSSFPELKVLRGKTSSKGCTSAGVAYWQRSDGKLEAEVLSSWVVRGSSVIYCMPEVWPSFNLLTRFWQEESRSCSALTSAFIIYEWAFPSTPGAHDITVIRYAFFGKSLRTFFFTIVASRIFESWWSLPIKACSLQQLSNQTMHNRITLLADICDTWHFTSALLCNLEENRRQVWSYVLVSADTHKLIQRWKGLKKWPWYSLIGEIISIILLQLIISAPASAMTGQFTQRLCQSLIMIQEHLKRPISLKHVTCSSSLVKVRWSSNTWHDVRGMWFAYPRDSDSFII